MLDLPNMEGDNVLIITVITKQKHLAKPYVLFIESEYNQAVEINRISKTCFVYC
jgi:hypothetical protein